MSSYLGFVIGGYLLGSILFAYVLPKLTRHIDIREMSEDGNPGTYNAFWYGGVICGICVLLLELLKGFFRCGCASGPPVCNPCGLQQ